MHCVLQVDFISYASQQNNKKDQLEAVEIDFQRVIVQFKDTNKKWNGGK